MKTTIVGRGTNSDIITPDYAGVTGVKKSPNFGERRLTINTLVLHYTGMQDTATALQWLIDPHSNVSCHYFVDEEGKIIQLVAEAQRAWHAGQSYWMGETDLNSCSIGIEIANPGHIGALEHSPLQVKRGMLKSANATPSLREGFACRDGSRQARNDLVEYPQIQINALIDLCLDLVSRYKILPQRVLGHSDIAPTRKTDPGEHFPWERLYHHGIGHFVQPVPGAPQALDEEEELEFLHLLKAYGYDIPYRDASHPMVKASISAFQRHFRPGNFNGLPDRSSLMTLRHLTRTLRHVFLS